jgi:signal transduction histidine kinase
MDAHEETARRLREAEAYELHDDVVQSLTVAQLAAAVDDGERVRGSVAEALATVQGIVARLLDSGRPEDAGFAPGELRRDSR